MPPLVQTEIDELSAQISQGLSQTRYACSSLSQLSGGSVNFVFRGVLSQPLRTVKSVIVKHSTGFLSVNREFRLEVSRWTFEVAMLNALGNFEPPESADVKTPRLYFSSSNTDTQVHEDFVRMTDLKASLFILPQPAAVSIGHRMGLWLRSFHDWASAPAQRNLRAQISRNQPMRDLKFRALYDRVIGVLENFPDVLKDAEADLESVRKMARKEFAKPATDEVGEEENWGIIHGDFWTGNILLVNSTAAETQTPRNLAVIDWEYAQFGHRAYDLGQMMGDLYERMHFQRVHCAVPMMEALVKGYGGLSDDLAFRTAIHAGVHLVCWYTRRGPNTPLPCTRELASAAIEMGRDLILRGWRRDKCWFESNSVLAFLFRDQ